jgi:hypothetical protein
MPKFDESDPARPTEGSVPRSGAPEPRANQNCPHMNGCQMFGLFSLAGALATWKTNYCSADYTRCERYQRASQGRVVPNNLMPNGALLRKWTPPA